jgi:hypothetical protein
MKAMLNFYCVLLEVSILYKSVSIFSNFFFPAAGAELRSDDPASLKHIIDEIQKETAKRNPSTIS